MGLYNRFMENNIQKITNEIVLYQPDAAVHLEVMIGDDTVSKVQRMIKWTTD
jgi:hypothetical protein